MAEIPPTPNAPPHKGRGGVNRRTTTATGRRTATGGPPPPTGSGGNKEDHHHRTTTTPPPPLAPLYILTRTPIEGMMKKKRNYKWGACPPTVLAMMFKIFVINKYLKTPVQVYPRQNK